MRIRKFNEAEEKIQISPDRVTEIITEITPFISELDDKSKRINSFFHELENFKSSSKKSNNQIDEVTLNLDDVKTKIDEATSLLDNVISLLKDYNEGGSKFLY
jgi:uncharacterized coiled-coil DUF342 family protein